MKNFHRLCLLMYVIFAVTDHEMGSKDLSPQFAHAALVVSRSGDVLLSGTDEDSLRTLIYTESDGAASWQQQQTEVVLKESLSIRLNISGQRIPLYQVKESLYTRLKKPYISGQRSPIYQVKEALYITIKKRYISR